VSDTLAAGAVGRQPDHLTPDPLSQNKNGFGRGADFSVATPPLPAANDKGADWERRAAHKGRYFPQRVAFAKTFHMKGMMNTAVRPAGRATSPPTPSPLHGVPGDASPTRGVFAIRLEGCAEGSRGRGAVSQQDRSANQDSRRGVGPSKKPTLVRKGAGGDVSPGATRSGEAVRPAKTRPQVERRPAR